MGFFLYRGHAPGYFLLLLSEELLTFLAVKVYLLVINFLVSINVGNNFFSSVLKDNFSVCRILGWCFVVFFSTENILLSFLVREVCYNYSFFSFIGEVISAVAFGIFSMSLAFGGLTTARTGVEFWSFMDLWLDITH